MGAVPDEFDVFISYKSEYKPWVESLAENLTAQGLTVWLDDWRKVAGDRVSLTLETALQKSKSGVIVVTPEAAQSGWVQKEYDTMMSLAAKKPGFRCIPAILRRTDGFPFLNTVFAVDFRDRDQYRRKLYELVCGLRGTSADPKGRLDGEVLEPPSFLDPANIGPAQAKSLLDQLFDALSDRGIVALLAQEGMATEDITEQLQQAARAKFEPGNVLMVAPPCCTDEDRADYFDLVARRCGLEGKVGTGSQFGMALRRRVDSTKADLLLILTEFENGPNGLTREFASALRSIKDEYGRRLRLVFHGGEKLAQLVLINPDFSILNTATPQWWPEMGAEGIKGAFEKRFQGKELPLEEAQIILELTGGEPRLIGLCLRYRKDRGSVTQEAYGIEIRNSDIVRQFFTPLMHDPAKRARACALLAKDDVGPFDNAYRDDSVERRLYWRNALVRRRINDVDRLVWRCQILRDKGRDILECG